MTIFKFISGSKIRICSNIEYISTMHNCVIGVMMMGNEKWDVTLSSCDSLIEAETLLSEIFNTVESQGLCGNAIATVDVVELLERIRIVNNDNLLEKTGRINND